MSLSSISSSTARPTFSAQEMSQNLFKKADANSDNSLSKDELSAALKNRPKGPEGKTGASEDVDTMFTRIDSDGDGKISATELSTDMQNNAPQGPPPTGSKGRSLNVVV